MSLAEEHEEDVQFMQEAWREGLFEAIAYYLEQGRVPGLKPMRKADVREFFEGTDELYWLRLTAEQPFEALSQLQQFQRAQEVA